jgi:hypothetical protein
MKIEWKNHYEIVLGFTQENLREKGIEIITVAIFGNFLGNFSLID